MRANIAPSVCMACFAWPREQVIANIRGGGEYGPKWHQAALKEKRHKAYEDVEVGGGVATVIGGVWRESIHLLETLSCVPCLFGQYCI